MTSEPTIRRRCDAIGCRLVKSRTRNPDHPEFGGFHVVDVMTGGVVFGYQHGFNYQATLEGVADFLAVEAQADDCETQSA